MIYGTMNEGGLENAIMAHAAISRFTNTTMYTPSIASESGFTVDADTFGPMHCGVPYLPDIRP